MKALTTLLLVCFLGFATAQTTTAAPTTAAPTIAAPTAPFNCTPFSGSCAKCFMAHPNCSYYWGAAGFYNTSSNGVCVQKLALNILLYNNQYNKTVHAYALSEAELNTTLGNYKLTVQASNLNMGALAVPCYDRHLCYCKRPPPPPPSRYTVTVYNCLNNQTITGARVALDANNSGLTVAQGAFQFFPITPGTYSGVVSATGFVSKNLNPIQVGINDTKTQDICLDPNPCTLQVITVLDFNSSALPGVDIVLGSGLGSGVTTLTAGVASFTIPLRADRADGITGSITGYYVQTGSFSCPASAGAAIVTLRFVPIPNNVRVEIRDRRGGALIPGATASFTTFANRVTVDGTSQYLNVATGSYIVGGAATGYISNSTSTGFLNFNVNITIVVFLAELPCGVLVNVVNQRNNAPVPNATITLNDVAGTTALSSDPAGSFFFSILFDAANNASAAKFGFNDGFTAFNPVCARGLNITVTIVLQEVLNLRIAARDVASPTRPFLVNAAISWNDVLLTKSDPSAPHFRILTVTSLPAVGSVFATAKGFNDKTTDYTFTENGSRDLIVSLAPQDFTLFFLPTELQLINGDLSRNQTVDVPVDGNIRSNYDTSSVAGISPAEVLWTEKPIALGGFAAQIAQPNVSRSYVANTPISSTITGHLGDFFAAKFTNIVPSSLSPFRLSLDTNMDNMLINKATGSNASTVIPVPNYGDIDERTLLFRVPFKMNSGFILVRAFGVNAARNAYKAFGAQDFVTCTLGVTRFANYPNPGGAKLAIFEYPTTFGESITSITVAFPTETYSQSLSGFRNVEEDVLGTTFKTYPAGSLGETAVQQISMGPQALNGLFTNIPGSPGLVARNLNIKLYITVDYFVIALSKKK